MNILRRLYTYYALAIFACTFLLIFPVFLICIWVPGMKKYGRKVNQIWANVFFMLIFLPVKVEGRFHIENGKSYVFAANHFSYIDIAMMGFIPGDVIYIGKSSLTKIPLFGYYFKKLHIAVDRSSIKSRGQVLVRAREAIDSGSSIVIFPEGGIITGQPPHLNRFKDGAFHVAIDKQIPLIPVTLSYNHLILPDDGKLLLNHIPGKIVIHQPLKTEGLSSKDVADLRETCYRIIQDQLLADNAIESAKKTELKTL